MFWKGGQPCQVGSQPAVLQGGADRRCQQVRVGGQVRWSGPEALPPQNPSPVADNSVVTPLVGVCLVFRDSQGVARQHGDLHAAVPSPDRHQERSVCGRRETAGQHVRWQLPAARLGAAGVARAAACKGEPLDSRRVSDPYLLLLRAPYIQQHHLVAVCQPALELFHAHLWEMHRDRNIQGSEGGGGGQGVWLAH
jgi:hypothetical protein